MSAGDRAQGPAMVAGDPSTLTNRIGELAGRGPPNYCLKPDELPGISRQPPSVQDGCQHFRPEVRQTETTMRDAI